MNLKKTLNLNTVFLLIRNTFKPNFEVFTTGYLGLYFIKINETEFNI